MLSQTYILVMLEDTQLQAVWDDMVYKLLYLHTLALFWEGRPCPSKYFDFVSVCVFVCLSTVNSSIFGKSSHFPFPYFVLVYCHFLMSFLCMKNLNFSFNKMEPWLTQPTLDSKHSEGCFQNDLSHDMVTYIWFHQA
jgi:hypothetical protein